MANLNVIFNSEKNGIELHFVGKPDAVILESLKANGFRWSVRQKMWYARHSAATVDFANSLLGDGEVSFMENSTAKKIAYDLFGLTRTDGIGGNYDGGLRAKEIAARIRGHVKPRFPMCNISVRSDYNSVDISIKASPFAKDSEELKAIEDYISAFASSFKRVNSDPYSDYYDANFYGGNCDLYYDYLQTEATEETNDVCREFEEKLAAFNAAEEQRRQREYEAYCRQQEEEMKKAREAAKIAMENRARVEAGVTVKENVSYFAENLLNLHMSKLNSSREYSEWMQEEGRATADYTCKVTKEVYMTAEQFAIFDSWLLDDWSFIAGTGGSATDDCRIQSMQDYQRMSQAERETVKWFSDECVAIFCEGKLKYVVDAQGYGYCRYVYFASDATKISLLHETEQHVTEENLSAARKTMEDLEDYSASVIIYRDMQKVWNGECFDEWKTFMKDYIYRNNIRFTVDVARAVPKDNADFKDALYRLLDDISSIQERFSRADLRPGQKITIVKISEFGGVSILRAVYLGFTKGKYAQYSDAVKLRIRPEHKRNDYEMWLYKDAMIYDGWLNDLPEDVLWDVENSGNSVVVKHYKYLSFDKRQYDDVFQYYKKLDCLPLLDFRDKAPERS